MVVLLGWVGGGVVGCFAVGEREKEDFREDSGLKWGEWENVDIQTYSPEG